MMNRLRGERCTNGVISIMFNRQREFRLRLIFNFILIATQNGNNQSGYCVCVPCIRRASAHLLARAREREVDTEMEKKIVIEWRLIEKESSSAWWYPISHFEWQQLRLQLSAWALGIHFDSSTVFAYFECELCGQLGAFALSLCWHATRNSQWNWNHRR